MPPIYINGQEVVNRYVGIQEVVAAYVGAQQVFSSGVSLAQIQELFSSGEKGVIYDFLDKSTLFQDSSGSTPVTSDSQPVWVAVDQSPNAADCSAASSGARPVFNAGRGLAFSGANRLSVPIDLSSTNKVTVVVSLRHTNTAVALALEFGNGNTNGGWHMSAPESPDGVFAWRCFGSTSGNGGRNGPNTDTPASTVRSCVFDLTQTGAAMAKSYTGGGLDASGVENTSVGGFANLTLNIGARSSGIYPFSGDIARIIVINRALTDVERANAEDWAGVYKTWGAVIGDSTSAQYGSDVPVQTLISGYGGTRVAYAGDGISDQASKWAAVPSSYKASYQSVIVAVGLNDVKARTSDTSAQIIADYQALINTIRSEVSSTCKIYACTLTPAKAWFPLGGYGGNEAPAYQRWLDFNQAISGGGATPVTNIDGYISDQTAALNDGAGNLAAAYDTNVDGQHVHPSPAGRQIIADAWRAKLVADRLLS